jgi:4-amino-4-deoxy-L-arabinose transferase-like glycosyltransferase
MEQHPAPTPQQYSFGISLESQPIHKAAPMRLLWLRTLLRYRVPIAGITSIALAVTGEWMMRAEPGKLPPNPNLGVVLLQVAALLVGVVAWVHNGLPLPSWLRRPSWRKAASSGKREEIADLNPAPPLPTRPRRSTRTRTASIQEPGGDNAERAGQFGGYASKVLAPIRWVAARIAQARQRAGLLGTLIGFLIVGGLAVWLTLMVKGDYANPLASWLWIAMLLALTLTVAGMRAWPRGASLVPHDPAEPAVEPPLGRREWLIVAFIILVAAMLRLWDLANLPNGIYIDEADQIQRARFVIRGLPLVYNPYSFFSTDWWGVPTSYFWTLGQALKLFGDNEWGARFFHALAGIGTVWFTYRIGRVVWSPRTGLLAGALLAVSDIAIHFSRSVTIATISQFGATACFYFLYKSLKTRRPWDWMMAGLMAALAYYGGYASAKILPPFLALAGLYVLLRWGFVGMRRHLPGLALMGVAFALAMLPHAVFLVTNPNTFGARTDTISIFGPQNAPTIQATYGTTSWPTIVLRQYQETYKVFDVRSEVGHFYPTGQPVLPVPWAALWVLGTAYMVWRVGDVRYAVMALWLLSGLTGSALTVDAPNIQRLTGMVPTLAFIPAVFMDRVAFGALPVLRRKGSKQATWRNRLPPVAATTATGALALFVVLSGVANWRFYLDVYNQHVMYNQHNFVSGLERYQQTINFSLVGRYVQTLDKKRDMVALIPNGAHYLIMPPNQFYFDGIESVEIGNLADALPYIRNNGKTINFVVYNTHPHILTILQQYFPEGEKIDILMPNGQPLAWVYKVDPGAYSAAHGAIARYGPPGDALFERVEPNLGTLELLPDGAMNLAPPSWLPYPLHAEWRAGLVAPGYGVYRIRVLAPGGGELKIDGTSLLTATPGNEAPTEASIVLAKGVHRVELSGELKSAQGRVELRWAAAAAGDPMPVAQRFLWNGPQGAMLGLAYLPTSLGDPTWYTTPRLPAYTTAPFMARLDGFSQWGLLNYGFFAAPQVEIVWRGEFGASTPGPYTFDAATYNNAWLSLWVDGKLVQVRGVVSQTPLTPMPLELTAGRHTIELRAGVLGNNASLELYWQPPNSERALMPPAVFAPSEVGAWPAAEMPGIGSPDPGLLMP